MKVNWSKLSDICNITKGLTGIMKAIPGPYPMVTLAEERKTHNEYQFDANAVIIPLVSSTGHGHASMKRIHYQEAKFALGTILSAVSPKDESIVSAKYLYYYLDLMKEELLVPLMKGMANVTLPMNRLSEVEVPIPDLVKQDALVSFMEEIRNRQTALSSELSHQHDIIPKLRQAILQDAIEGKITENWRKENSDTEPAKELIEKIKAKKTRLVEEKKIKNQKSFSSIKVEERPFELPEGWDWCRLGDICTKIGSGSTPRGGKSAYTKSGVPFLRSQNVHNQGLELANVALIPPSVHQKMDGTRVSPGDVLLNITGGSIGRCVIVPDTFLDGNVSQHVCIIRPVEVIPEYIHIVMLSCYCQRCIIDAVTGAGREGLPKNRLEQFCIPVPPFKEQQAIIKQIKIRFDLCDNLEAEIIKSERSAEHLSTVILQDVFEVPEVDMDAVIETMYPAAEIDNAICGIGLEITKQAAEIPSMDQLAAILLATNPEWCKPFLKKSDIEALNQAIKAAPQEMFVSEKQSIAWKECRDYLELRNAINVTHDGTDQPITAGSEFNTAYEQFSKGMSEIVSFALKALGEISKLRKRLGKANEKQKKIIELFEGKWRDYGIEAA